jgi:hypothetical protein
LLGAISPSHDIYRPKYIQGHKRYTIIKQMSQSQTLHSSTPRATMGAKLIEMLGANVECWCNQWDEHYIEVWECCSCEPDSIGAFGFGKHFGGDFVLVLSNLINI